MGVSYADKPKQPWEEIQDHIEFSGRLAALDTITAKTVTGYNAMTGAVDNSIVSSDTISGTKILFVYKGGIDGGIYKISFKATSNAGQKVEEDFIFEVREY